MIGSNYGKRKINTFSIGLEGSIDLHYARIMAKYIGSNHHEIKYTPEEGIRALPNVINAIETYDVTTVRASTPMYIIGKYIKHNYPNIKVLLSGEGSNEIFGGYLYFKNAPSNLDFHKECIRRTNNLYKYDCLRAHKSLLASGIECRVPFLDKNVIDYVLSIDPMLKIHKVKMEKYLLRQMFKNDMPMGIVFRIKDQFSDAVSSRNPNALSWIDELKKYSEYYVKINMTNYNLKTYNELFYKCTTFEEKHYKMIYYKLFNKSGINLTELWSPVWTENKDPSGMQFISN